MDHFSLFWIYPAVCSLDIAKMTNHLLMFRNKDENIDAHELEMTLAGAEVMYELSNLKEAEFADQLHDMSNNCGF